MKERRWDGLVCALFAALSALLLRGSFGPDRFPGGPTGEGWGRLFVTSAVARWLRGEAPWGVADLAAWPDRLPFWPVDPLVQAVAAPLSLLFGPMAALTAVTALLLTLAGLGPYVLVRQGGGGRAGAAAAGLVVQLAPYLLRNLEDLVLEVEAVGLAALAIAAAARLVEAPGRGRALLAAGAIAAVASSSPYFAVYLALGCAVAALLRPARWRGWLALAGAGALGCALALAPLLAAEGGAQGRLGPTYAGHGYRTVPEPLVRADGSPWRPSRDELRAPPAPAASEERPAEAPRPPPPAWRRALHRLPGGAAVGVALLLGLLWRPGRPFAALGLLFFVVSPGPTLLARAFGMRVEDAGGALAWLLARLPLTASLGNPSRALAAVVLLAAVAAGRNLGRRGALALAALALLEAGLGLDRFALSATTAPFPASARAALQGPTVVFPSGDPPIWNPAVGPKEVLAIAARAEVPVAYDYGRGRPPADLGIQVQLAAVAGAPVGRSALEHRAEADPIATGDPPFARLLVLEDRLSGRGRAALRAWLEARGAPLAEAEGWSVWPLPLSAAPPERPAPPRESPPAE